MYIEIYIYHIPQTTNSSHLTHPKSHQPSPPRATDCIAHILPWLKPLQLPEVVT